MEFVYGVGLRDIPYLASVKVKTSRISLRVPLRNPIFGILKHEINMRLIIPYLERGHVW